MQNDSELTIFGLGDETTVPLLHQFVLGTRLDADVVLQEPGIAPTHLVINPSSRGALLIVLDQDGQVPVLVEGQAVTDSRRLRHGDVVRVGLVRLVYRAGVEEYTPTSIKNPYWNQEASAAESSESSLLESQSFSWLAAPAPSVEERVARTIYRLATLSATASSEAELLEGALTLALEGAGAPQGLIASKASANEIVPIAAVGFATQSAEGLPFELRYLRLALDRALATTLNHGAPTLYVPIVGAETMPEGVLCLRREPGAPEFSEVEAQLAASVGRQLASAVERVRLLKQLRAGSLAHGRLQRRFHAALGAIAEGLVLVSGDGSCEPLNATGAELLGAGLGRKVEPGLLISSGSTLGTMVEDARRGVSARQVVSAAGGRSLAVSTSRVEGLDAVVIVLRDISGERRQEEANRHAQQSLREEILKVSGREQRRIGQNLHDGLCQQLVGISLLAQGLVVQCGESGAAAMATEIVNLLSKAAEDTRRLAKGLCPVALETSGLGSALEELAGSFQKMYPAVTCYVEREGEVLGPRDPVASHLYHIAQEAVSNAIKHGQPESVTIRLDAPNQGIRLAIENDGLEFRAPPESSSGMGLRTMNYRAQMLGGTLSIEPGSAGGTCLTCRLPRAEQDE